MTQNCFRIKKVYELKEDLKADSREWINFDEQLKTNSAFIYYLKSGQVILLPNDVLNESQGILFEDKTCYLKYLDSDRFPIENPEKPVYDKCQEDILNITNNINKILNHLHSLTGGTPLKEYNINDLNEMLKKLRKIKKALSLKEKLYMALALGEYVRRVNNGVWLAIKYYGKYNPYYVPALHYRSNDQVLLILDFFKTFFDDNEMTAEIFSSLQYIKAPGFRFKSLGSSKFPKSYIEFN